jgi:hypothetical protein
VLHLASENMQELTSKLLYSIFSDARLPSPGHFEITDDTTAI